MIQKRVLWPKTPPKSCEITTTTKKKPAPKKKGYKTSGMQDESIFAHRTYVPHRKLKACVFAPDDLVDSTGSTLKRLCYDHPWKLPKRGIHLPRVVTRNEGKSQKEKQRESIRACSGPRKNLLSLLFLPFHMGLLRKDVCVDLEVVRRVGASFLLLLFLQEARRTRRHSFVLTKHSHVSSLALAVFCFVLFFVLLPLLRISTCSLSAFPRGKSTWQGQNYRRAGKGSHVKKRLRW